MNYHVLLDHCLNFSLSLDFFKYFFISFLYFYLALLFSYSNFSTFLVQLVAKPTFPKIFQFFFFNLAVQVIVYIKG